MLESERKNGETPYETEDGRRALSVAEFCLRYGLGRTAAYREMKTGRLRYGQIGKRRRRIDVHDAERWFASWMAP